MKNNRLQEQMVELRILLQGICDGFNVENLNKKSSLTMRIKVLYALSKTERCCPSILIEKLGIAKSNLALLCKSMCEDGVIAVTKSDLDKRNIYYSITPAGKEELGEFYAAMADDLKLTDRETRVMEKKFGEIIEFIIKKIQKTTRK